MLFKKKINDETNLLNYYLLLGWAVIICILMIAYTGEVLKTNFNVHYLITFAVVSILPYSICLYIYKKTPDNMKLRYYNVIGYSIMYCYVLFTGHTKLVFTYIFPLLTLILLYHDFRLIIHTGGCTLLFNLLFIFRDYKMGQITLTNSRDYEIQIALILICFTSCYLASILYDRISTMRKAKEEEIVSLLKEQIKIEEYKKNSLIDSMTGLGNRRKYNEYIQELHNSSCTFYLIALDSNGLKKANDTLGHPAGDEMIVGLATCIRSSFHDKMDGCYRMGGDEFAILSPCTEEVLKHKLNELRTSVTNWRGTLVKEMSVSIGYVKVDPNMDLEMAMRKADEEMYIEKNHFYSQTKNDRRTRSN